MKMVSKGVRVCVGCVRDFHAHNLAECGSKAERRRSARLHIPRRTLKVLAAIDEDAERPVSAAPREREREVKGVACQSQRGVDKGPEA